MKNSQEKSTPLGIRVLCLVLAGLMIGGALYTAIYFLLLQ